MGATKEGKNKAKTRWRPAPAKVEDEVDAQVLARRQRFQQLGQQQPGDYGLVSRGEELRLQNDPELRKQFFRQIQQEFVDYCSGLEDRQSFKTELEEVDLNSSPSRLEKNRDMDWIFMSLRKLREALLAVEPDDFSKRVFVFCVRVSTKIGNYQTYLPSLNYLLGKCRPLLSKAEAEEMASYLVLHMSHFNNDNLKLLLILHRQLPEHHKLKEVLGAWFRQDFLAWRELWMQFGASLGFFKLMSFGEKQILAKYLHDVGKSYFLFSKKELERLTGYKWEKLQEKMGELPWRCEGDSVIIRERSKRGNN